MAGIAKTRFLRSIDGNISIVTALVGTMLITAVGASMDGGRLITTKQKLQSITDAAALMAMKPDGISDRERVELARSSVAAHVSRVAKFEVNDPKVEIRQQGQQVYVALSADIPLLFGAVLGGPKRVSTASIAEETITSTAPSTSISIVMDLSQSMSDRFDRGTKLADTRSAVSDMLEALTVQMGGEAAAKSRLSTGLYAFNWGLLDDETVELEAGAEDVLQSLSYMSVGEGSLATTAIEQAVEDQLEDAKDNPERDRFIVYLADNSVDEDKSDRRGQYLNRRDLYETRDTKACIRAGRRLAKLDQQLRPSPNGNGNGLLRVNLGGLSINLGGRDAAMARKRVRLRDEYIRACQPVQTKRVIEACEQAREKDVSVIAVNLSGEDGEATNTADSCVAGMPFSNKKKTRWIKTKRSEMKTKTLPSGLELRLSEDEASYSGDVENLEQLKEMLDIIMPDATRSRYVRLVQ